MIIQSLVLGTGALYLLSWLILREKPIPKYIPYEFKKPPEKLYIPLPVGHNGRRMIWLDLARAPHMIVAGETFGGKSGFLHQLLTYLVRYSKIIIIDMKKVEFPYMRDYAWMVEDLPGSVKVLQYLTREVSRRLDQMKQDRKQKIQDYKGYVPFGYITLIVDELSQLSPAGEPDKDIKKVKAYALRMLIDLSALARCCGIHLILSTQRPDADVLPGLLKANIPAKIAFPVTTEINSRIILDSGEAASLPNIQGRAIFKRGRILTEVQVQHLEPDDAPQYFAEITPDLPRPPQSIRKRV